MNDRSIDACFLMAVILISCIGYAWNQHKLRQSASYKLTKSKYGYLACVVCAAILYWMGGRI